eukprot:TRINITY_DN57359_c0_g1_i1.p1 TRINITY_DN57359_c0_g1~~TRINITY_DN57359_c0_g1_i1.p1  ORF type:complete len:212 (+),score=82.51 TRINITY_DN57359_c0_g1_i1:81-638(+)
MVRPAAVLIAAFSAYGADGALRCLAEPNRSPDDLGYAISIVCDPKHLDCSPINEGGPLFWPNDIYAHCNWAFNKYWETVGQRNATFCNTTGIPPGKARVFNCTEGCTKCQVKNTTSDADAVGIYSYLCQKSLGPLCAPINAGGAMANASAQEKASYVANIAYQPVACDLGAAACDFKGAGEIVKC